MNITQQMITAKFFSLKFIFDVLRKEIFGTFLAKAHCLDAIQLAFASSVTLPATGKCDQQVQYCRHFFQQFFLGRNNFSECHCQGSGLNPSAKRCFLQMTQEYLPLDQICSRFN